MAEYESIHGTRVRYLSSDPTLTDSSTEGQVWYNSTSGTNKSLVQIKAWNSSGVMPVATNNNGSATQGTQTASLSFGGGSTYSQTIEYNGSGWAAGGNLGTPRFVLSGAGVQTAALGFGGYKSGTFQTATEEYDGSSWTAGGALGTARGSMGGNGTQTAALAVTGAPLSPGTQSEEYDGSSWTAGGNYPVAQQSIAVAGPQTAALGAGGISGGPENGSTLVTNYDGSSWTVVSGTIPNGQNRAAYAGTQTHAVVFGGNINTPPPAGPGTPGIVTTATNEWDGSTFTITANMATARQSFAGAGTATSAIGFAGDKNPGASNDTEEYNSSLQVLNPGVWAAGGNLNTARGQLSCSGLQTAAIAAGGLNPGAGGTLNNSEEYNGSSWTEGNNLNDARRVMLANGPQTAAFVAGGFVPANTSATEEYSGSSWATGGNLNTARRHGSGAGTQTAGLAFSGYVSAPSALTEEYNGTSWTVGGTLNTAKFGGAGSGTQTAAFSFSGAAGTPNLLLTTENYDGSSWTTNSHNIGTGRYSVAGSTAGTQTASLLFGGLPDPVGSIGTSATEQYDGSSWSQVGGMANARSYLAGAGTSANGLATGGNNNPWLAATEEFTSGSAAVTTASTLTTS